jgi:hypothetical protein
MRNSTETFFVKNSFTHSTIEPDNCPGGNSVEVHDFSFHPERLSEQSILNTSKEILGYELPSGWHDINNVKSVSSPNHCQHDLSDTDRLTHPHGDLISRHALFC